MGYLCCTEKDSADFSLYTKKSLASDKKYQFLISTRCSPYIALISRSPEENGCMLVFLCTSHLHTNFVMHTKSWMKAQQIGKEETHFSMVVAELYSHETFCVKPTSEVFPIADSLNTAAGNWLMQVNKQFPDIISLSRNNVILFYFLTSLE